LISGGKAGAGNGTQFVCLAVSNSDLHDRDVAAGIAILTEAGGLITTANPPSDPATAAIEEVKLGSRLYLAIR
jgi:fructose-1,6-bisphosphatase/inositol monophosphatase family enzyme